ncbi:MAG: hypothetical protein ACP5RT_01165 [Candidatus Micrarchaeia archaeon]
MLKDIDKITKELEKEQKRLDGVIALSSQIIRLSGQLITALHSDNKPLATNLVSGLKKEMRKLRKIEKGFEYYSLQAHQEFVEALSFNELKNSRKLPSAAELDENNISYLLGIMDLVGELKRESLDELRKGGKEKAIEYYELMKDIYDSTLHIRFANSLLPNFRKKQDVARIQLESVLELLSK